MGRNHSDNMSAAGNQRCCLAGVDAGLQVDLLILRIGHEIARSYVRRNHPVSSAQGNSTSAIRVCAHPLPKSGSARVEPSEGQQSQFAASAALPNQHLHTGVIGAHDPYGSINNPFVQCLSSVFMDKFRTDVLQHKKVGQLRLGRFADCVPERSIVVFLGRLHDVRQTSCPAPPQLWP